MPLLDKQLTYHVPYPPSEVKSLLQSKVDVKWGTKKSRYEGSVTDHGFFINKRYYRGNSSSTVAGRFKAEGAGSEINVRISASGASYLWIVGSAFGTFVLELIFIIDMLKQHSLSWIVVFPPMLFCIIFSVIIISVHANAGEDEEFLDWIFEKPSRWEVNRS